MQPANGVPSPFAVPSSLASHGLPVGAAHGQMSSHVHMATPPPHGAAPRSPTLSDSELAANLTAAQESARRQSSQRTFEKSVPEVDRARGRSLGKNAKPAADAAAAPRKHRQAVHEQMVGGYN